jgi:hypothetical protein
MTPTLQYYFASSDWQNNTGSYWRWTQHWQLQLDCRQLLLFSVFKPGEATHAGPSTDGSLHSSEGYVLLASGWRASISIPYAVCTLNASSPVMLLRWMHFWSGRNQLPAYKSLFTFTTLHSPRYIIHRISEASRTGRSTASPTECVISVQEIVLINFSKCFLRL